MTQKIYYLTRSYYPYQKGGGPLMRAGAVRYLKDLGWDVTVVMPNYESDELVVNKDIWQIPFERKNNPRWGALFQRVGIYEDYLDKWVEVAFKYLKEKIHHDDIVFSTCGGELGMIKLGSLLKEDINCRFVVNFRDPLDFGYMNGLKKSNVLHVSRKKQHEKYIANADLILTSSQYYSRVLKEQFVGIKDKIHNNYFGYTKNVDLNQYVKFPSKKLRIAYSGIMSNAQKPEVLYEAYKKLNSDNIELYFLGNRNDYVKLQNIHDNNVHFIDFMPHHEFLKFMCKNIDVGFVSLVNDYYGACVPSKIYEYINLGLPILGVLPDGDGKDIINGFGYGEAIGYNEKDSLVDVISEWINENKINEFRINILSNKNNWSMEYKISEVNNLLNELVCRF